MWVTVDELRAWLGELARSRFFDAAPAYLIRRRPERDGLGCYGAVVCVAGDVRNHVSASELDEWAAWLARGQIVLQILVSDAREVVINDSEAKKIERYLRKQSAALEASAAEWEPTRAQIVEWDAEARRQLEACRHLGEHIGCIQAEPPAQQGGGGGEDSDSDSYMYQVACPSCPRCTSLYILTPPRRSHIGDRLMPF